MMTEIRFHGRAGQGMVTAAEVVAMAATREGKYAQAFPVFGSEKRGPPVASFCKISDSPITTHEQVTEPDVVVVADHTVIGAVDVTAGLKPDGWLIVNSNKPLAELGVKVGPKQKTLVIDGTGIALNHLGKAITNTVMLGAFVKATGLVKIDDVKAALKDQFPAPIAEKNAVVVQESFDKATVAKK